jgi:hypothetical protein
MDWMTLVFSALAGIALAGIGIVGCEWWGRLWP